MTTWTDLRKALNELPPEKLVELLKGLHDLSPQNNFPFAENILKS
jgi:hypothetical protein